MWTPPNRWTRPIGPLTAVLCLISLTLAGCAAPEPVLDDPTADALSALRYPGRSTYGPDLDIVLTREGSKIRLTNRTARSYTGLQLWLNQQYVQHADRVAIGPNPQMKLATFINRHREPFPTGSFLQPERAKPVISAELYDPVADVRYRVLVRPDNQTLRL